MSVQITIAVPFELIVGPCPSQRTGSASVRRPEWTRTHSLAGPYRIASACVEPIAPTDQPGQETCRTNHFPCSAERLSRSAAITYQSRIPVSLGYFLHSFLSLFVFIVDTLLFPATGCLYRQLFHLYQLGTSLFSNAQGPAQVVG